MVAKNISVIVSDLSQKGSGRWGGAIRPFLLAKALQKLGHTVKLFGLAYESKSSKLPEDISIFALECPYYTRIIQTGQVITRLLKEIDGDILYAVKVKPSSFGLALVRRLQTGRPLILDIDDWEMSWYGGDNWQYKPSAKQLYLDIVKSDGGLRHLDHPLYLKWLEKYVASADAITIHTEFMQKRFTGVYVPNGKDINHFDPACYDSQAARLKYGLDDYRVLMFPGAPRPYKGLEDILTALELLQQADLRLVIVGGSPYDDYDQHLLKQWGKWIITLPQATTLAMPEIVAAADIVVVPQRYSLSTLAQFPLKLTDGMAMAKPILATKVGDIPTILGDTGFLVEPEQPTEMAQMIDYIFAHPQEAYNKGQAARKRCIQHYSLEAMASCLHSVIEGVSLSGS